MGRKNPFDSLPAEAREAIIQGFLASPDCKSRAQAEEMARGGFKASRKGSADKAVYWGHATEERGYPTDLLAKGNSVALPVVVEADTGDRCGYLIFTLSGGDQVRRGSAGAFLQAPLNDDDPGAALPVRLPWSEVADIPLIDSQDEAFAKRVKAKREAIAKAVEANEARGLSKEESPLLTAERARQRAEADLESALDSMDNEDDDNEDDDD